MRDLKELLEDLREIIRKQPIPQCRILRLQRQPRLDKRSHQCSPELDHSYHGSKDQPSSKNMRQNQQAPIFETYRHKDSLNHHTLLIC